MTSIEIDKTEQKIIVRELKETDLRQAADLSYRCFGPDMSLKYEHMKSQIEIFPRGQVCAVYDGRIVGLSLSLIINFDDYGKGHSYEEISDDGYIRNHNPNGINLYGIEVGVDVNYRNLNIGRKMYEERQRICEEYNLKSIIIGGRMPNFHKYADRMTAEEYGEAVMNDEIYDPVMTFQKKNGFELKELIPNYLVSDEESRYYATSMEWTNKAYTPKNNE